MMQEFTQELKNLMHDTIRDLHTATPGKITAFDPDKCEASVLPYARFKKPDGTMMDFPSISRAPVFFMQGASQGATIVYPVKSGDECLILYSEQALDIWRVSAEKTPTDLRFDLTNAIVIVGLFSRANPLVKEAISKDSVIIDRNGTRVMLLPDNAVDITGDTTIHGKLTVSGDVNAESAVYVTGNVYAADNAYIDGIMTAGAVLSSGDAGGGGTIEGDLNVKGNVTIDGTETLINGLGERVVMNRHSHTAPDGETSGPHSAPGS